MFYENVKKFNVDCPTHINRAKMFKMLKKYLAIEWIPLYNEIERLHMKNLTYLELYKREPKIAQLLLINHYFKPHSITWITLQLTTLEVGGQHVLDKYIVLLKTVFKKLAFEKRKTPPRREFLLDFYKKRTFFNTKEEEK